MLLIICFTPNKHNFSCLNNMSDSQHLSEQNSVPAMEKGRSSKYAGCRNHKQMLLICNRLQLWHYLVHDYIIFRVQL